MKVVLVQDVPRLGRVGEVREVADGYGRNFLLPKKLALPATPSALKQAEVLLQKEVKGKERLAVELSELAQKLEGFSITFKEKVVAEGRLYGSVREVQIAQELSRLTGFEIGKGSVELEEPIQQLGSYEVTVRLAKDLTPRIKIIVEEEKEKTA